MSRDILTIWHEEIGAANAALAARDCDNRDECICDLAAEVKTLRARVAELEPLAEVGRLQAEHAQTWADKPLGYWADRLAEEAGELESAVHGHHEHPWQFEAAQIASICINMLLHFDPAEALRAMEEGKP